MESSRKREGAPRSVLCIRAFGKTCSTVLESLLSVISLTSYFLLKHTCVKDMCAVSATLPRKPCARKSWRSASLAAYTQDRAYRPARLFAVLHVLLKIPRYGASRS